MSALQAGQSYAVFEADVSRDGVRVVVRIELDPDLRHPDEGEIGERVGHEANRVLAREVENAARAQLPF